MREEHAIPRLGHHAVVRTDLPAGTVTLVFTDIEGSTRLLHELGTEGYAEALAEHRRLLREAFGRHGGVEVDTQGDAFFYVFADAREAVTAAEEGREASRTGPIHARVGVHTGTPHLGPEGYVGHDVHLGARIGAAGHGGQVLLSAATRAAAGLADDVLLDLGEHRLKDFDRPVPIFQLGAERFPPLKSISNTNLPRPASSFIGREREVQEVVAMIRGDGARLVTLTGPGGSGKTRLSIEAAAELVGDHRAGTFWVELVSIRDPALVIDEIAATIGAQDGLAEHIGERELLLVLDNLEQVIDVAPAVADLVEACPNLVVLATSRERLRVRGEIEIEVRPLAEPEAVELFVARAGLPEADGAVRELCRALDEMPLAIELAAARAKVLPAAKILERLSQRLDLFTGGRDADPRQRTLRSTIEWSYDLLDAEEQRLFARLAVFAGEATLEAAERVADADLDTLGSLVDKSLVHRTDDRYWMFETIRGFALERLEASGEATAIRRRHAEHFLASAEEAEPHLIREALRRSGPWTDRIEEELDDIRAATDLFEAEGDGESALRMAGALVWFSEERGRVPEFRRRVEWALAAEPRPSPARAGALIALAALSSWMGERDVAKRSAEDALAFHRAHGDAWRIGDDVHTLGVIAAESEDWETARAHFEEAARLLREAGDEDYALWAMRSVGWTYHDTGDLARAREIHETNLVRAREIGNRALEGTTLGVLGTILVAEGRAQESFPLLEQAYRLHREVGQPVEASVDLWRFAEALAAVDRPEEAVGLASLSAALREEIGTGVPWVDRKMAKTLDDLRERLDPAAFERAWERGRRLTPDAAVALALAARSGS
ncbi:MAG TPA: tetratricopeptide repeat protein [Actinomycetota bacterium]|nr:tetratricopeptide repeat protein [Actinomycetota bacterium]